MTNFAGRNGERKEKMKREIRKRGFFFKKRSNKRRKGRLMKEE